MYRIFTELWVTEFHHHEMNFSGTMIITIVTEETSYELFTWNFDIVISVYLCVTKILSQQG